ncbi:MAG: tol-pal system protein YbgF [Syntrophobacteraceae bacterium]|nr:tol-pal system protein YbgF [Syntrophobacteraceae bacterium]
MKGPIKERVLWYCVVVVFAGLLAGCASTSETSTLQENLAILNQRQAAVEKRVQDEEGSSRRSGDLYSQMQDLQAQMRSLNGRIDQVQHKVDELQQNMASAAQPQPAPQPPAAMPPSGTVVMPGAPPVYASPPPAQPPRVIPPPSAPPAERVPPGAAVSPPPVSRARPGAVAGRSAEQVEFDRGVQLLQQRNYEAAKKVFEAFLTRYPRSGLGENALYNIGECCFGQRHYEDAIKAFQAVVDKYPKGGKTASALLREGMGWQGIGENTMARIIYTRLVTDYPGTAQARTAEKKLNKM